MEIDEDTRVEDLWFSSDAIVLRAEKKIFRVTKSILAARSSIFRDMFVFPQPGSDETEMIDGSPIVSLTDSAEDVEVFLRAIFDSNYFMPPPVPVQLHVVLGNLRLAHKYDVQYLYLRALQHLSVRYSTSMAEYHRARQNPDHIIYAADEGPRCLRYISIIAAAQQVEALWLLPVAYYLASRSPQDKLRLAASAHGADADIVHICLAARAHLMRANCAVNRFLSVHSDSECAHRASCDAIRFSRLDVLFELIDRDLVFPLEVWKESEWDILSRQFCDHCFSKAKENHQAALEKFWDQLPAIFGLPPWPELSAMRDAVMGEAA